MGKSLHTIDCHELLARFDDKREGMVLIYLLAMADDEGWVDSSVYTMARMLFLHRQTLSRIIQRLCQKGYAVWDGDEEGKRLRVGFRVEATTEPADQGISQDGMAAEKMDSVDSGKVGVTSGVTTFVTDDVTVLNAQNDSIKRCMSGKYKDEEIWGVTGVVTGMVTPVVTQKETKENKEEIPPAPPKEENKQKKEKTPAITHACKRKSDLGIETPSLSLFFEPESTALDLEFPTVEPESTALELGFPIVEPESTADGPETSAVEPAGERKLVDRRRMSCITDLAVEPETSAVEPAGERKLVDRRRMSCITDLAVEPETSAAEPAGERKPKKGRVKPTESLERRRKRFLDGLSSYACRYGDEMIKDFGEYWTETTPSNTRMRFELQRTWNTSLRLARWAKNAQTFNYKNNNYDKFHQPTSADYIRDAQLEAIRATEQFIREAERRRGGVPPHLPF